MASLLIVGIKMRVIRLLGVTALMPLGACHAQTHSAKTNHAKTATKANPTEAETKKPKKSRVPAKTGTKLHPEQERAYAQAYKTGAVSRP